MVSAFALAAVAAPLARAAEEPKAGAAAPAEALMPTDVTFKLKQAAEVLEASKDPEDQEIARWLRKKEGLVEDRPTVRSIKGGAS